MLGITTIYYETAIYAVMLGLHEQFKVYTHTPTICGSVVLATTSVILTSRFAE